MTLEPPQGVTSSDSEKYPYYHGAGWTSSALGPKRLIYVWGDRPYEPPRVFYRDDAA